MPGEHHAMFLQYGAVIVVDLITVAVAFMDGFFTIERVSLGFFVQNTRIGTKP